MVHNLRQPSLKLRKLWHSFELTSCYNNHNLHVFSHLNYCKHALPTPVFEGT